MAYRALGFVCVGLLVAVSCAGDPEKKAVSDADAGAGGEAGQASPGAGGSVANPSAGAAGDATTPGGAGGEPAAALAGAGGEPSSGGGDDQGGGPSAGAGGQSQDSSCEVGQYLPPEGACQVCPTKDDPYYPTPLSCSNYDSASYDPQTHLLTVVFTTDIHDNSAFVEGFTGMASVSWVDDQLASGADSYTWTYLGHQTIQIALPDVPATAQSFSITYLTVADACEFSYYISGLSLYFSEVWSCGIPPDV